MRGKAYVGDKVVMESEMMAQIVRRDKKKCRCQLIPAIKESEILSMSYTHVVIHPNARIGNNVKIDPSQ